MLRDVVHRRIEVDGNVAHAPLAFPQRIKDGQAILVGHGFAQLGVQPEEGANVGLGKVLVFRYLHVHINTALRDGCQWSGDNASTDQTARPLPEAELFRGPVSPYARRRTTNSSGISCQRLPI